jgi:predicted ATPase/class 3 adenylate cyclase
VPSVPTGEVTFVFTDIEGSTALFHELDALYLEVLAHHNALLRKVWDRWGGVEVKTEGDAFFVAFGDATAALAAAADCQRALASATWQHGRPVRVRIGMHTGTAVVVDEDYVGLDVHQAARVAGAAYGGQVLLTEATLAAATLGQGLGVHDLGSHRLKDFPTERRLLQLTGPGLDAAFPPPRTTTARSHNLPRPPTPLVGRSRENEAVQRAVVGDARLVTLTGSGGLGKTRLALESSWSVLGWFREGVWFVDLASLTEASAIPFVVAQQLALTERAGTTAFDLVVEKLSGGPCLLVLDNLEQLVEDDGVTVIADLLAACADLTVLATSRERLRLRGEQEVLLDRMSMNDSADLFVARATAADHQFTADRTVLEGISEALDGIPLALELAAARVRTLTAEQLLDQLTDALDLLTEGDRDLPVRQRTMRATIAWSWNLCDTEEQDLLRSLSVFAGSAPPAALEAVHAGPVEEILSQLVDRSMAVRREDRVTLLVPVRAFVAEQVDDQERAAREARHARWYGELAAAAEPHLITGDQGSWLDRLDAESAEVPLALDRMQTPEAIRSAGAIFRWWVRRSRWSVGRQALDAVLARPDAMTAEPGARALALIASAEIATLQGDTAHALVLLGHAEPLAATEALGSLIATVRGKVSRATGDLDGADAHYRAAVAYAAAAEDERLLAIASANAAETAFQRASADFTQRGRISDTAGVWLGDAQAAWGRARDLALEVGDEHLAMAVSLNLAVAELTLGDPAVARGLFFMLKTWADRLGDVDVKAQADHNLAIIYMYAGENDLATEHFESAMSAAEQLGDVALQGRTLYFWALMVDEDAEDVGPNLARCRRSILLAQQTGDAVELQQRTVLLQLLREKESALAQP